MIFAKGSLLCRNSVACCSLTFDESLTRNDSVAVDPIHRRFALPLNVALLYAHNRDYSKGCISFGLLIYRQLHL